MLPPAEAIERYLQSSRDERWFSNFGPCAELLRTRLAGMVDRPCVVVANATLGLITAIAAVPKNYQDAVVAVDIKGLSYKQAARQLCAPVATIASRVSRGRQLVARSLDESLTRGEDARGG